MTPLLSLGISTNSIENSIPLLNVSLLGCMFIFLIFSDFSDFSDFIIFLTGEESLKFGGVNFQRTESGRFINKNGQELSNDAMAASKFLLLFILEFIRYFHQSRFPNLRIL
jgi:hypothetical protein